MYVVYNNETKRVVKLLNTPYSVAKVNFDSETETLVAGMLDHTNYVLVDGKWVEASEDLSEGHNLVLEEVLLRLNSTDWVVIRHRDQLEAGQPTSISQEKYLEYLRYRNDLRNLDVSDPNVTMPTEPVR